MYVKLASVQRRWIKIFTVEYFWALDSLCAAERIPVLYVQDVPRALEVLLCLVLMMSERDSKTICETLRYLKINETKFPEPLTCVAKKKVKEIHFTKYWHFKIACKVLFINIVQNRKAHQQLFRKDSFLLRNKQKQNGRIPLQILDLVHVDCAANSLNGWARYCAGRRRRSRSISLMFIS